jgi:photosystem II stability/assembly factor-like uncharacterized protein
VAQVDGELARLYLPRGQRLEIWSREGGMRAAPLPPEPLVLTRTVASILPSPNYAQDDMVLATIDGWPGRSLDGGETWERLRGGLPEFGDYKPAVSLAFSPAFADDGRVFAGIALNESHGEGVYCSQDRGDTWNACGDGLLDLRVYRVQVSPAFAQDSTLLAYVHTSPGDALYRSADAGQSWELVVRQAEMGRPPLPNLGELFYLTEYDPEIECDFEGVCRRSDDGGQQWTAFDTAEVSLQNMVDVRLSPQYARDKTIYFLTQSELYRYQEQDQVWSRCQASQDGRPVFGGRGFERYLASLAVAATAESAHLLMVGSVAGEFYRFADTDLTCTVLAPAPSPATPSPTPVPTPCQEEADVRLSDLLTERQSSLILARLGCALEPAVSTGAAVQSFENGAMVWREDRGWIYVLTDVGKWSRHDDSWMTGQPEPDLQPPPGLYAPVRGFGKLWQEQLGGSESPLGWATAPEKGTTLLIQTFAGGTLIYGDDSPSWVLYSDGTWAPVAE